MFEKYLQDIGLNEKESIIYLALLAVDNSSILELAEKTKIKRPTVYLVIESLAKKGLVSETTVGKKTHYQAEPPERLETYVEQRKLLLDEQSKKLKDIIPQIKSVQRESGQKPIVQYFEGKEGVMSMNMSLFEESEEGSTAYVVYPKDLLDEVFPPAERATLKKTRIAKKIHNKALYTSKTENPSDPTSDRIRVDGSKYPISCDISIYKDNVRFGILGKKISGIYIKSSDLAETLRSLISLAIDQLKK
jgi:sugar-specific transcriptional regulator TrmB